MLWDELVKLALLGTDRSTLSATMKAELQDYGIDTDKEMTEVILESAALQAPLQKAGFQPAIWKGEALVKSPKEKLASCSQKSINHLTLIIGGRYPLALSEFVQAMTDHNKCLPFELLPEFLDKCVKEEALWEKLQPTIGNRGSWLIGLNPAWQKLKVEPSHEKWEIGTKIERIAILKKIRAKDPAAGLTLLLSTWAEDSLAEKTAFLKCLAIELSDLDEVFLEECLDFPRKEIREQAAILLRKVPNSQLQKRLLVFIKESIGLVQEDGIEKPKIYLPSPKDKRLIRDRINPKKKWRKGGEATGMIYQMVANLVPERWEKFFQKRPDELLDFFAKSEWAIMLIEGIAAAAILHNSVDWKETILRFWLTNYSKRQWQQLDVKPIFINLPNEVFNEVLYEKLKALKLLPDEQSPFIQLLQKEDYIWDNRLTNVVMDQLKEWIGDNVSYSWSGFQYRTMLKRAAYSVNPKMEKQLSYFWFGDSRSWAGWEKDIQQFLMILSFRKEMLEELESDR